jgi:hypothetical protein
MERHSGGWGADARPSVKESCWTKRCGRPDDHSSSSLTDPPPLRLTAERTFATVGLWGTELLRATWVLVYSLPPASGPGRPTGPKRQGEGGPGAVDFGSRCEPERPQATKPSGPRRSEAGTRRPLRRSRPKWAPAGSGPRVPRASSADRVAERAAPAPLADWVAPVAARRSTSRRPTTTFRQDCAAGGADCPGCCGSIPAIPFLPITGYPAPMMRL